MSNSKLETAWSWTYNLPLLKLEITAPVMGRRRRPCPDVYIFILMRSKNFNNRFVLEGSNICIVFLYYIILYFISCTVYCLHFIFSCIHCIILYLHILSFYLPHQNSLENKLTESTLFKKRNEETEHNFDLEEIKLLDTNQKQKPWVMLHIKIHKNETFKDRRDSKTLKQVY